MWLFFAGAVLFFSTHLLPAFPQARAALHDRLGDNGYRGLYSLVALAGIVLIVMGYGDWRASGPAILYVPPVWMSHLVLLLMLPVFPLLFAAYMPGKIAVAVKHPMILAVKVWAFSHFFANGDVASLALFGLFLAWGVIDRISLKRRERAGLVTPPREGSVKWDAAAVVLGLVVYGLFVWRLHTWLIGVPVIA